MEINRKLMVIDATIISGTSITITLQPSHWVDSCEYCFKFCLTGETLENYRTQKQGKEIVLLKNGVSGTTVVLEDKAGDVFYSDLLHLGREYVIRYGNNGAISNDKGGLAHFINLNSPCCATKYNPANSTPEV